MTQQTQTKQIPGGWKKVSIGQIGIYENGRAFKEHDWKKEELPIIRIQNLTGTRNKYNYFQGDVEEKNLVRKGDLLVSWSATLDVYIWGGPKAVLNQHIFKVYPKIDKKLLYYLLKEKISELYAKTHGTGMVHITKGKFEEYEVILPESLHEQTLIVSAIEKQFTRLNEAVKSLKAVKEKLEIYRKAVLKRAFENGEETLLGKAFEIIMGQSPSSEFYNKNGRGLPFFQGKKEFTKRYANIENWTEKYNKIANKGDLLVSIRAPIGPCNIAPEKCAIGRGIAAIRAKNKVETYFLFNLVTFYGKELDRMGTGTTFKAISKNTLNSFVVKLPKKEEWRSIVSSIESKFSVIDKIEQVVEASLEKAEKLRKSILKSAFEGKLVNFEGKSL